MREFHTFNGCILYIPGYSKRSIDALQNHDEPDEGDEHDQKEQPDQKEQSDKKPTIPDKRGAVAAKALEIGEKALEKQFEIMEEQQKKGGKFVDEKVKTTSP